VEFPIARDFPTYESEKAKKLEGIRPEAVKAIDDLKPYKGGNAHLWRIHELDNIDKHRALYSVAKDQLFTSAWMPEMGGVTYLAKATEPLFSGVLDSEVGEEIRVEIEGALSNVKIEKGGALLPTIDQLLKYVDGIVASFEVHLA
jgi:hypothetical protein